jgi:hypothetical protein
MTNETVTVTLNLTTAQLAALRDLITDLEQEDGALAGGGFLAGHIERKVAVAVAEDGMDETIAQDEAQAVLTSALDAVLNRR